MRHPDERKGGSAAGAGDEMPRDGVRRENMQGWIPDLATPAEIRDALEKAFDYRGDVTITVAGGERIEGYVFDRRCEGPGLEECRVRLLVKGEDRRVSIRYSQIERLEFTGKDTAAGRSLEAWIARYRERKARGEKDVFLAPEPLD